jgi:hypothetical protein
MKISSGRILRRPRLSATRSPARARGLGVIALLSVALAALAQTSESDEPRHLGFARTAELVGASSEIARLRELSASKAAGDRWEILWLHQRISERILAASLQVDATIAQIDNEIARANEVRGFLADRRDRTVNRANLLGILIGGGLGATSSGLQLSSSLDKPAAAVGISGGTISAGLALMALHSQKGATSKFDFDSNMLAEFFDRPTLPDSRYSATVWAFLNETAPSSAEHLSRKAQLMQTWVEVKRIDSLNSTDKISRVTSQPSELFKLSIDDLEDRAAMLQDVRAKISFLKRDLGGLLTSLPEDDEGVGETIR